MATVDLLSFLVFSQDDKRTILSALVVPRPVCRKPLRDRSRRPRQGQAQMAALQVEFTVCLASGACHDVSILGFGEAKGSYRQRGRRTNPLNEKVFTLHPRLRNAQTLPGNRRELTDAFESQAETVE